MAFSFYRDLRRELDFCEARGGARAPMSKGQREDDESTQSSTPERLVAMAIPSAAQHVTARSKSPCPGSPPRHSGSSAQSSGASSGTGVASARASVPDLLAWVNSHKITRGRPRHSLPQAGTSDSVCLVGETSGRIKWIQPSGPRRPGEGTEDEEQGVVSAEETATGGIMMCITLLASGFIIGPNGASVREVCRQTGADIKSWTDQSRDEASRSPRPTRTFVIEGKRRTVVLAVSIICDAIDRYKELCEGAYCGQYVPRMQTIRGIAFSYQPPPRNIVPYAAALKGQSTRVCSPSAGGSRIRTPPLPGPASNAYAARILADVKNCLDVQLGDRDRSRGHPDPLRPSAGTCETAGHRRHSSRTEGEGGSDQGSRGSDGIRQPPCADDKTWNDENISSSRAPTHRQAGAPSKRSFTTTSSSGHASGPLSLAPGLWELPPLYPAYGMAPLPSIPQGYALVAPNLLLPLNALQGHLPAGAAATSQPVWAPLHPTSMAPPQAWPEAFAAAAPAATSAFAHFAPPPHAARQDPSRPASASRLTASPHPPADAVRRASTGSMGTPSGSPQRTIGHAVKHANGSPPMSGSYGVGEPHHLPAYPAASVPGALYHGYLGPVPQGNPLSFIKEAPVTPAAQWADPQAPYSAMTPFGISPYGTSFSAPLTSSSSGAAAPSSGTCSDGQATPQPAMLSPSEAMHAAIAAEHPNIARAWLNNRKVPLSPPPPGLLGQQYTMSPAPWVQGGHPFLKDQQDGTRDTHSVSP